MTKWLGELRYLLDVREKLLPDTLFMTCQYGYNLLSRYCTTCYQDTRLSPLVLSHAYGPRVYHL